MQERLHATQGVDPAAVQQRLVDVVGEDDEFEVDVAPGGRGCLGRLQSAGPFLAAVKNSDQFQPLAADPVRNDVGGIRHHQLTRAENTSWATHLGVCSEQIDCL